NDPDHVTVLLLEEVHRTLGDGLLVWLLALMERERRADLLHDALVDTAQLVFADRSGERDVEGRVVRPDPRALLHHLVTQRLSHRLVEQVRRRAVAHDRRPPWVFRLWRWSAYWCWMLRRERSRCSYVSPRKPSASSSMPRSVASSRVSSSGNPNVSGRRNASAPDTVLAPRDATFWNCSIPSS